MLMGIGCPNKQNNKQHTIVNSRTEHPQIGDITWYDCIECDISFATGFNWSDEHPVWSDNIGKEDT